MNEALHHAVLAMRREDEFLAEILTVEEIADLFRAGLRAIANDPGHDATASIVPVAQDREPALRVWRGIVSEILK